jgi:SIR2-like domain
VNYNFDDLLDEKLREQHVKCRTVVSGKDVVPPGTLPCYHVHGLISSREYTRRRLGRAQGTLVFSEDEYHAEYSDPYKWSNMTQMSLLGRYTGLFIGLSMEDPNIRRLIDVTHRQYPENVNYAILPRKNKMTGRKDNADSVMKNLFEEVESNSFGRIGVKVIWVDSFEEIPDIIRGVCGAALANKALQPAARTMFVRRS